MTEDLSTRARDRGGIVLAGELGSRPARTARRRGLVQVQPGAYAAATQRVGAAEHVRALQHTLDGEWAFLSDVGLWLQGAPVEPERVEVGVPFDRLLRLRDPARCRRVSEGVLAGLRMRDGSPVVRLEVAAVQWCVDRSPADAVRLVEDLLRQRLTTGSRLRDACTRGLEGSELMRRALSETGGKATELRQRRLVRALRERGVQGLRTEYRLESSTSAVAYLDVLHLASRRALEVDGAATHGTAEQQLVDRRRDRWVLAEHGIETVRIAVREIDADLAAVVEEVMPMLVARAA